MENHVRRIRQRAHVVWMLIAVMLPLVAATASAQRWEYFYGGTNVEEGHGGVQPVSSGGYVSVGVSYSTPTPDIYVVRTDYRGGKFWEATYDIAGNEDIAYDILELANGNFAITGFTTNYVDGVNRNDMFILILDRCGVILRSRTFGMRDYYETGFDIIETRTGNPGYGTAIGDLVVAGYTTYTFPDRGLRDAWLIRVTSNLNIIWSRRYEVGPGDINNFADDALFALDECVASPPLDPATYYTSDIVAVGTTYSAGYTQLYDGLMLRVDGNTGLIPAGAFVGVHGGNLNEGFRSVDELEEPYNNNRGNIVTTGYTTSTSNNAEVYIVRTPPQVWRRINDRTLGDNLNQPDEGFCIREIRVADMGLTAGNLIVTGYVTTDTAAIRGWGNQDVFLQEYQGNLTPVAPTTRIYGGVENDVGWSVSPVGQSGNCRTAGFIASGYSWSPLCNPPNSPQMYILKTNNARSTNCMDVNLAKVDSIPVLPWDSLHANILEVPDYYDTTVVRTCRTWGCLICVTADFTVICPIAPCPAGNCNDTIPQDTIIVIDPPPCPPNCDPPPCPPNCDTMPAAKAAPGVPGPTGSDGRLIVIPNPVTVGETFAIDVEMEREARVEITVTNMQGELVTTTTGSFKAGARQFPIETSEWAPGAYLITISDGARTVTAKVVVTD